MVFIDDSSLSLGRYTRSARFPVIPPDMTYAAYGREFAALFEMLPEGLGRYEPYIRSVLYNMIEQMLTLPASSTHHHRTAGGLFFHSFETGVIAAKLAIDEGENDSAVLASLLAGFLHDIGKSVSLFRVSKFHKLAFVSIEDLAGGPPQHEEIWDPNKTLLADWCADQDVSLLALEFLKRPRIGHVQEGASLWRSAVHEALLDVIKLDEVVYDEFTTYLDGYYQLKGLRRRIAAADNQSINRDLNPTIRTEPKRSDLHLVRRFIEYIYLAQRHSSDAPFVNVALRHNRQDAPHNWLAFFIATPSNIYRFLDYVRSEDLYGYVIPDRWWDVMPILENHGILKREAPNGEWDPTPCLSWKYVPPLRATLDLESVGWGPNLELPLCHCPFANQSISSFLSGTITNNPQTF